MAGNTPDNETEHTWQRQDDHYCYIPRTAYLYRTACRSVAKEIIFCNPEITDRECKGHKYEEQ